MKTLGNIFWLIAGGLIVSLWYFVLGLIICLTVVGIPFGFQLWKFGRLALAPFGKEIVSDGEPGCLTIAFNVLWIILGWWEVALIHLICSVICCITIVGIPLGIQHFKLASYSIIPFGRTIRDCEE